MSRRTVGRVEDKVRLGPDAQVDDKAIIIAPRDPRATDPFLALAEDWFSEPGFEWHPHRGIETVTIVLDGVLEHGDNAGNAGALLPGDIQWMTAGRGVIHRELALRNEFAHTLQLWVNLPARRKMVDTGYQDLRAGDRPSVTAAGGRIDVVSGEVSGVRGPARNQHPIQACLVTVEPGSSVDVGIPPDHRAFLYVIAGQGTIAGRRVREGQVAWSDPAPGSLTVACADREEPLRVMACSGRPLREPVALGGPFVMNSRREIETAYADFHAGRFGAVPRQPRLKRP